MDLKLDKLTEAKFVIASDGEKYSISAKASVGEEMSTMPGMGSSSSNSGAILLRGIENGVVNDKANKQVATFNRYGADEASMSISFNVASTTDRCEITSIVTEFAHKLSEQVAAGNINTVININNQ